jgi:transposase-like protein
LLDDPGFLREVLERVLQEMLEAQMTHHIGAAPYERSATRSGHRNGYKPRTLRTRVGTLKLLVPQDREGTFSTRLFSRYQRNEKALVLALMEMYIEGVSTRKVKEVTEELCGTSFSKSLVSQLAGSLDSELEAWRGRVDSKLRPTPTCSWTPATRRSGWIIRWLTGAFWSSRALGTTASGRCLA